MMWFRKSGLILTLSVATRRKRKRKSPWSANWRDSAHFADQSVAGLSSDGAERSDQLGGGGGRDDVPDHLVDRRDDCGGDVLGLDVDDRDLEQIVADRAGLEAVGDEPRCGR